MANVGALVGVVGALAAPAVAPVALGAAIGVGVVTGIYGIGRATSILVDRRKHKQVLNGQRIDGTALNDLYCIIYHLV